MSMKPITLGNLARAIANLKEYFLQIKDAIKTVNGSTPDANGDVTISRVDFAGDLESSSTQHSNAEYIQRTTGGAASIQDGDAWLLLIRGNSVHTGYVPEVLTWELSAVERDNPITATFDRATFLANVSASAEITLTYTSAWSANPATYGFTITGTPVDGDQIAISYTKEERGTITTATPESFASTGWNLYSHTNGYAKVMKYSDDYGFRIEGTYTALQFSTTETGTKTTITPVDGAFTVPSDGYVWVTGGNSTDTAVFMTWENWTEGYPGDFAAYDAETISFDDLMTGENPVFPYGLCRIGTTADEINLALATATRRIGRMDYSAENLATAIASGRDYEADTDYIYIVLATPETTTISLDGSYTATDHGLEYFTETTVPVYAQTIYGASLKNKLERDVLTVSQQTLNSSQQGQVRSNLGLGTAAVASIANNLTTTTAGSVLDARQGYNLNNYKSGDSITLGQYMVGVANTGGTSILIDFPMSKTVPSSATFSTTYDKPSQLRQWDGTALTVPSGAAITVSRQSARCIRLSISGLSVTANGVYKVGFGGILYATIE